MSKPFYLLPRIKILQFCVVIALMQIAGPITYGASGTEVGGAPEDPIVSIQKALKKQELYKGEANGVIDEQTKESLRRFQAQAGLPATGEVDTETLKALQLAAQTGPSPRERAEKLVESDRKFLKKLEVSPPAPTPSQPALPPPIAEKEKGTITPEEALHFVQEYLQAAEQSTFGRELAFYADVVDYFEIGRVSRRFIGQDQLNYYRRWPSRHYTLLGPPVIERVLANSADIRFRIQYELRNGDGIARGRTENLIRVAWTQSGLKITVFKERKLRS